MIEENADSVLLLERAKGGDQSALVTLLEQHGPRVERQLGPKIASKWRSVLCAEDVMQITYMEVFLHIEQFQPHGTGAFESWLRRIAENNLRDAVRSLSRKKRPQPDMRINAAARDGSAAILLENIGFTTTTPSRHAGKIETQKALDAALERLPEDYARVIRMYELEGASAVEVAKAMNRSEGAVYMLRGRALDRLREIIGSESMFFSDGA